MQNELGYTEKTNGLVLLIILLFTVFATLGLFRPHRPSPFSAGSGYGTGWGTESIMVGGGAKRSAAH
jgi:hypothetical protein